MVLSILEDRHGLRYPHQFRFGESAQEAPDEKDKPRVRFLEKQKRKARPGCEKVVQERMRGCGYQVNILLYNVLVQQP